MTRLQLAQQLLDRSLCSEIQLEKLDMYILLEGINGPVSTGTIMERSAASRRTVQRHIRHLMEHNALSMESTNHCGRRFTYHLTDDGKRLIASLLQ